MTTSCEHIYCLLQSQVSHLSMCDPMQVSVASAGRMLPRTRLAATALLLWTQGTEAFVPVRPPSRHMLFRSSMMVARQARLAPQVSSSARASPLRSSSDPVIDPSFHPELGVDGPVTDAAGSEVQPERAGSKLKRLLNDPVAYMKEWWAGAKMDKAKLAALGASAVCSYGLVSNFNYCLTMMAAFVIFARRNGISPLAPGQWKGFLAIYGGLWAAMNFLRPIRFWISVGLTPYFDKIVDTIRVRLGVSKRVAFATTVFLVNVCGTFAFLGTGMYLASLYVKVPIFPPKV